VTNTKCRIDTVISSDDGYIVARNIYSIEINILKKKCAPNWLYLQDCVSVSALVTGFSCSNEIFFQNRVFSKLLYPLHYFEMHTIIESL